jgi:hypothetical protein
VESLTIALRCGRSQVTEEAAAVTPDCVRTARARRTGAIILSRATNVVGERRGVKLRGAK